MKLRSIESTSIESNSDSGPEHSLFRGCVLATHSSRIANVDLEDLELEALQEFFENAGDEIMNDDCSRLLFDEPEW